MSDIPDVIRNTHVNEIDPDSWIRLSPHRYRGEHRAHPSVLRLVLKTPIGTASALWMPGLPESQDQLWAGLWTRLGADWARESACRDGQPLISGEPGICDWCRLDPDKHEIPTEAGQQTWQITNNTII